MTPTVLNVAFGGEWQKKNKTFKMTGNTEVIAFVVYDEYHVKLCFHFMGHVESPYLSNNY